MTDLRHNEPLVKKMLKTYWANYSIKPDTAQIEASIAWGMGLDKETLEYALDIDNHGDFPANRNPRLVDLKRLAYAFMDARGDFFRPPLPDTSLPAEPICLYCAEGDVYDVVFTGDRWAIEKTGTCAVCSGGTARGNPVFIEVAEKLDINVGKVVWQFSLSLIYYKLQNGLTTVSAQDVRRALEVFGQQQYTDKTLPQRYGHPATPAEAETGTQVCPEPDKAPGYDFGDGWKPETDDIPF